MASKCCAPTCASSFHSNTGGCSLCHETCETCTGPLETECTACEQEYFLSSLNTCNKCADSCKTCNGDAENDCLSCKNDYFLELQNNYHIKGKCLVSCPSGIVQIQMAKNICFIESQDTPKGEISNTEMLNLGISILFGILVLFG